MISKIVSTSFLFKKYCLKNARNSIQSIKFCHQPPDSISAQGPAEPEASNSSP